MSEPASGLPSAFSIPRQAVIEGMIEYNGPVIVNGTVEGAVTCATLLVTERGIVNGAVNANAVTVLGEINGEIVATNLTLKAASSVTGDIYHKHLVLESGCYFEGRSRRFTEPLHAPA